MIADAIKRTEYTMEEDIKHVLFSLIDASGNINRRKD